MSLIQGARSSLQRAKAVAWEMATREQRWIQGLERRLPFEKVLAAIANKRARQLWAMLAPLLKAGGRRTTEIAGA